MNGSTANKIIDATNKWADKAKSVLSENGNKLRRTRSENKKLGEEVLRIQENLTKTMKEDEEYFKYGRFKKRT